jgi:hypothetical protein
LKKRAKKLLSVGFRASSAARAPDGNGAGAKVFCFLFLKKKAFLALRYAPGYTPRLVCASGPGMGMPGHDTRALFASRHCGAAQPLGDLKCPR